MKLYINLAYTGSKLAFIIYLLFIIYYLFYLHAKTFWLIEEVIYIPEMSGRTSG